MNINVGRIVGVACGMALSFCAILFGLFCAGIYLHEPGVQDRHLNVVIGFLPFLFTFWIVYRSFCTDELESCEILYLWEFYPKAFLRAVIAEVCVFAAVGAFMFFLEWSWTRQARDTSHPGTAPPPIMQN